MADVEGLQERLRKIEALMAGAGTPGERDAAGAALERVKARLAEQARRDPPIELQFPKPALRVAVSPLWSAAVPVFAAEAHDGDGAGTARLQRHRPLAGVPRA